MFVKNWEYRTHLEQDDSIVDQTLFAEFCLGFLDLQRFAVRYQAVTPVHDVQDPLHCGHSLATDTPTGRWRDPISFVLQYAQLVRPVPCCSTRHAFWLSYDCNSSRVCAQSLAHALNARLRLQTPVNSAGCTASSAHQHFACVLPSLSSQPWQGRIGGCRTGFDNRK